mmetsp:Transcript_51783/g.157333  ORF Transcript_51783/g.157333 Transcript_51783/m.157333 type:complete len:246 (-) Transcript_51783:216-953(-)
MDEDAGKSAGRPGAGAAGCWHGPDELPHGISAHLVRGTAAIPCQVPGRGGLEEVVHRGRARAAVRRGHQFLFQRDAGAHVAEPPEHAARQRGLLPHGRGVYPVGLLHPRLGRRPGRAAPPCHRGEPDRRRRAPHARGRGRRKVRGGVDAGLPRGGGQREGHPRPGAQHHQIGHGDRRERPHGLPEDHSKQRAFHGPEVENLQGQVGPGDQRQLRAPGGRGADEPRPGDVGQPEGRLVRPLQALAG